MPKVQISRGQILDAALQLLIREGYGAITIVRLAKELGCSTQPISWTFGNMDNFREEFVGYVMEYLNSREPMGGACAEGATPVQIFASVGVRYLRAAIEKPNLIYFVRSNSHKFISQGGTGTVFDKDKKHEMCVALAEFLGISEELTAGFMQKTITYTQGLVSMVTDGVICLSLDEGIRQIEQMGRIYLVYAGVSRKKAEELCDLAPLMG